MSMEQNAKYIYAYMLKAGWSKQAICGMLGNIQSESGIENNIWEGGHGPGYGLVQWTPASKLQNWCSSRGMDWHKISSQCARIDYEMKNGVQFAPSGTYGMTGAQFIHSTESPQKLGLVFLANYERPLDPNQPQRGSQAVYWYNKLSGEDPIDISEDPSDAEARKEPPETPNFYLVDEMLYSDESNFPFTEADDKIGEYSIELVGFQLNTFYTNSHFKDQVQQAVKENVKGSVRFEMMSTIIEIIKSDCEYVDEMFKKAGVGPDTPIAIGSNAFDLYTTKPSKLKAAYKEYIFQMQGLGYKNIVAKCDPELWKEIVNAKDDDEYKDDDSEKNNVNLSEIILWDPVYTKDKMDPAAKIWTYAGYSEKVATEVATDTDGILTKHEQTFTAVEDEDPDDDIDTSLWDMKSKEKGRFVFLKPNVDYPDSFFKALKKDPKITTAVVEIGGGFENKVGLGYVIKELNDWYITQAGKCQDAELKVVILWKFLIDSRDQQVSIKTTNDQVEALHYFAKRMHTAFNVPIILELDKNELYTAYVRRLKVEYWKVHNNSNDDDDDDDDHDRDILTQEEYDKLPQDEQNKYVVKHVNDGTKLDDFSGSMIKSVNDLTHEFFNEVDKKFSLGQKNDVRNSAFDMVLLKNMNIAENKYPQEIEDILANIYKNESNDWDSKDTWFPDDYKGDKEGYFSSIPRDIKSMYPAQAFPGQGSWDILTTKLESTNNVNKWVNERNANKNSSIAGGDAAGPSDGSIESIASSLVGYFIGHYLMNHAVSNVTVGGGSTINSKSDIDKNGATDCSGFVWIVLKLSGHPVPPNMGWFTGSMQSDAQGGHNYLTEIEKSSAGPGDILIANQGGTSGAGAAGHTAVIASKWDGGNTYVYSMGSDDGVIKTQVKYAFGHFSDSEMITARAVGGSQKTTIKNNISNFSNNFSYKKLERIPFHQTFKNYGLISYGGPRVPEKENVYASVMPDDYVTVDGYKLRYGIDYSGRLSVKGVYDNVDNWNVPIFLLTGAMFLEHKKKNKPKIFSDIGFWRLFQGQVKTKPGLAKLLYEPSLSALPVQVSDEDGEKTPPDVKALINKVGYITSTNVIKFDAYSDHSGTRWIRVPLSDGKYYIDAKNVKFLDPKPPERR